MKKVTGMKYLVLASVVTVCAASATSLPSCPAYPGLSDSLQTFYNQCCANCVQSYWGGADSSWRQIQALNFCYRQCVGDIEERL